MERKLKRVIQILNILVGVPDESESKLLGRFAECIIKIIKEEGENCENYLDRPIAEVELSVRANNLMRYMGIETIGDLMQHTKTSLLKTKNLGRRTLSEIENVLKEYDLKLKY
jgi:DNA-directed RNA polymerase alpha subunit